jgi:hypothetical protein
MEVPMEVKMFNLESWPITTNGGLEEFRVNDQVIWEGEYDADELAKSIQMAELILSPEKPSTFKYKFQWMASTSGYKLLMEVDAGCILEGEW